MLKEYKKKQAANEIKKELINNFLKEHEKYIPKYSPKGLKFDWDIYIYKDGEHNIYTGEFLGQYRVGITQKPPLLLSKDNTVYEYDTRTKTLIVTEGMWR